MFRSVDERQRVAGIVAGGIGGVVSQPADTAAVSGNLIETNSQVGATSLRLGQLHCDDGCPVSVMLPQDGGLELGGSV